MTGPKRPLGRHPRPGDPPEGEGTGAPQGVPTTPALRDLLLGVSDPRPAPRAPAQGAPPAPAPELPAFLLASTDAAANPGAGPDEAAPTGPNGQGPSIQGSSAPPPTVQVRAIRKPRPDAPAPAQSPTPDPGLPTLPPAGQVVIRPVRRSKPAPAAPASREVGAPGSVPDGTPDEASSADGTPPRRSGWLESALSDLGHAEAASPPSRVNPNQGAQAEAPLPGADGAGAAESADPEGAALAGDPPLSPAPEGETPSTPPPEHWPKTLAEALTWEHLADLPVDYLESLVQREEDLERAEQARMERERTERERREREAHARERAEQVRTQRERAEAARQAREQEEARAQAERQRQAELARAELAQAELNRARAAALQPPALPGPTPNDLPDLTPEIGEDGLPRLRPMFPGAAAFLARFLPASPPLQLGLSSRFCDLHTFLKYLHELSWYGYLHLAVGDVQAWALVYEGRVVSAAAVNATGEQALGELLALYEQGATLATYPLPPSYALILSGVGPRSGKFEPSEFTGVQAHPGGATFYLRGEAVASLPAPLPYEAAFPAPPHPQTLILPRSFAAWAHHSYALTLRGRDAGNPITGTYHEFRRQSPGVGAALLAALAQGQTPADYAMQTDTPLHDLEPALQELLNGGYLKEKEG